MPGTARKPFALIWLAAWAMLALPAPRALAKEFVENFDEPETSWTITFDNNAAAKVISHRRQSHTRLNSGPRAEGVEVDVDRQGTVMRLQHALPPALQIDDLVLSVWVRSNRPGAVLSMRVVFPHHRDPLGKPLVVVVQGDAYTTANRWQPLKCSVANKQIEDRIPTLRATLHQPNIDQRGLYVDAALLTMPLESGPTELFIDELHFGPIVTPQDPNAVVPVKNESPPAERRVEFRSDRLQVDGRPVFMRMAAHHNEPIDVLKDAGFNAIWVPNYDDENLLTELNRNGIWAVATPPVATDEKGKVLSSREAGLVPFTSKTAPILAWYIGTGIPADAREELINLCDQTQTADRVYQRPIMADVLGAEHVYSRHLAMLGTTRHFLNTTMSPRQYREWLIQKQRLALPGSYLWTWIQTEPVAANTQWRQAAGREPILIEPEQIGLQVYAAISAGIRGVGFWKTTPLNSDGPGALERRLAISQVNLELELIEPFLATGRNFAEIPFTLATKAPPKVGQLTLDFRDTEAERAEGRALRAESQNRARRDAQRGEELKATVFRTNYGVLVIPVWYQEDSQYVPRRLAGNDAKMIVQGVDDTAKAWEISTTHIRGLVSKKVAGGVEITLPFFDQKAFILFTSNANLHLIDELRQKINTLAPRSARLELELAEAKLERTVKVHTILEQLGDVQDDAPQLLAKARQTLQEAKAALDREAYHDARLLAGQVLQCARMLQSWHWDKAVASDSPISNPYTICYQTLPDYWRMLNRLGGSSYTLDDNLLRSGDFEDNETMIVSGWKHSQNTIENVRANAELVSQAQQGKLCLRLFALPTAGVDAPEVVSDPPVTVTTPPMSVRAGQILHISGWVKVSGIIKGNPNGVVLYDSLIGPAGALRWTSPTGSWQRFVAVREVHKSGEFTITISLTGLGIVQFDDVRVIPHTPAETQTAANEVPNNACKPEPTRTSFWDRVPRFRPRRDANGKPKPAEASGKNDTLSEDEKSQSAPQSEPDKSPGLLPRILPRRR